MALGGGRLTHPAPRAVARVLVSSDGSTDDGLVRALVGAGYAVTRLVPTPTGPDEIGWDPGRRRIDARSLEGQDAVVHLGGAGITDHRWTPAYKRTMRDSRVGTTVLLAEALASLSWRPSVLVCASDVSVYGDRGDEELTEDSQPGTGFLARVVGAWEAATAPAAEAGIRVACLRGGAVVSDDGSPPGSRLFPFKLGMAGRTGGGRQWLSWISGADHTAAMLHVLATETLHGPVNLTAPNPVTNAEFAAALVRVLRRPAVVPIPNLALDLLLGKEMARETVTASRRALPAALEASGFTFRHADLDAALRVTAAR